MEDDLDRIADGEEETAPWLTRFYLGPEGLHQQIEDRLEDIDARELNSINLGEDDTGRGIVIRVGRYGPYLQRDDDRASIPDNLPPDELTLAKAIELLDEQPAGDKILGTDPESGLVVLARNGRFGPYVQLGEAVPKGKPKTSSLFKSMSLDSISLDSALQLLTLPRVVGVDPASGADIVALNGRYGPYLDKGGESRSLGSEEELFTVTLEESLALFEQPPTRTRRATNVREIGATPEGKTVTVRSGRYGPYVTDGETNASLRAGDDADQIDLDRALDLLSARRDRLADTSTTVRKSAAKKSTKAKKATKKSPRKKPAKRSS